MKNKIPDNADIKLFNNGELIYICKKGTNIVHNEYGPADFDVYGNYKYLINNEIHRLSGYAVYNIYYRRNGLMYLFDKYLGKTKEEFIQNLANVLIPKEYINEL